MSNTSGTGFNSRDATHEGNSGKRRTISDGRSSKRSKVDSLESRGTSRQPVLTRKEFRSEQASSSSVSQRIFMAPPGLHHPSRTDKSNTSATYVLGTGERIVEVQKESARHNLRLIDDPQKRQIRRSAVLLWGRLVRRDVRDPFNPLEGFDEEEIAIAK